MTKGTRGRKSVHRSVYLPVEEFTYPALLLQAERTIRQRLREAPSTAKLPLMAEEKTLFQKIMDREEPGEILYEDDQCVALRDINPQAPTHVLIVPRKPIPTLDDLSEQDETLIGHLFLVAQKVAGDEGLTNGYRTVFNNGSDANQTVAHIHLHLIGGRRMFWPPG